METPNMQSQMPQKKPAAHQIFYFMRHPAFKYVGFSLLLTYHYVLWFSPDSFLDQGLLSNTVTISWLFNLLIVVLTLLGIAAVLGRKYHLSDYKWLLFVAPLTLSVGTLCLCYMPATQNSLVFYYVLAIILGAAEAILWVLWGEQFGRSKATFAINHIGITFSVTLVLCMVFGWILPTVVSPFFTAIIPAASAALLAYEVKTKNDPFPPLLPKEASKGVMRSVGIVCGVAVVTSMACYFLAAIIPWQLLPSTDRCFMMGILASGALMFLISCMYLLSKGHLNIFKLFPWMIYIAIIAFALFVAMHEADFAAFLMALAVSSIMEIMLIVYFGILTSKGYFAPAIAFSLAAVAARAGILVGNGLALTYEAFPEFAAVATEPTSLIFMCVLAMLLIPLVRQEIALINYTSAPLMPEELDVICGQISQEFKLSEREAEILLLLARGKTASKIAEKLVISPHTVNTHIRHIYEKTQIHKRSELIDFINLRRSDS